MLLTEAQIRDKIYQTIRNTDYVFSKSHMAEQILIALKEAGVLVIGSGLKDQLKSPTKQPPSSSNRAVAIASHVAETAAESPDWREGDKLIISVKGCDGLAGIMTTGYTPEEGAESVQDAMVFLRMLGHANGLGVNISQIGRN